ncbi:elongation factor Ts [Bryobacterales bacterium F-183]|nr:elongation factor Ts [Bryobacterales bacterium F-183]
MSEISAQLVKQLREATGAGMMECKKALVEANGSLEEAIVILRKRGLASAAKKSSRATKQGLIVTQLGEGGKSGAMVEVNCESDFVARTDDFQALAGELASKVVNGNFADVPELLGAAHGEAKVEDALKATIAKLGENISIARFGKFEGGNGVVGSYIHPGAQLGVLLELTSPNAEAGANADFQELLKDVAMQIAAVDPKFIRREDVTPEAIEKEKEIQKARVIAEGKPEKVAEKIVEGRMGKFYEEICLLEQPFIKDGSVSVGELLKQKGKALGGDIGVHRFVRFKVGETALQETAAEE